MSAVGSLTNGTEKRKAAYAQTGKGLSCYQQQATHPMLKAERPSLSKVHSQVLQNVVVRIDLAMRNIEKPVDDAHP